MKKLMKISNYILVFTLISLLPFLRIVNDPNKTVSVFNDPYIYELDYKMKDGTTIRSIMSEQLITNGDFSNGTMGWTSTNSSISVIDGIQTWIITNAVDFNTHFSRDDINTTLNVKYYFNFRLNPSKQHVLTVSNKKDLGFGSTHNITMPTMLANQWHNISRIGTFGNSGTQLTIGFFFISPYVSSDIIQFDYIYMFNISSLITNKQYSSMYDTTFDLMTDEQIKLQMDHWVNVYEEHKDDLEYSMFNNMLSDNNPDNYTPFELGKLYVEEGLLQFIPRNTVVREGQHRLTKFTWPFLDNLMYLFREGMQLLFVPVYNVLAENIPILPSLKDTNTSIQEGVDEFYLGKTIIGSNLQEYTLNYYDNYTGSNWLVEDVAGWEQYKVVFNTYNGIYNLSNTIFNGRFTRSSLDLEIIDDYTVVNLYYDSLNDLYIFQLRPDGFLNKRVYKYATDSELKEFFMIS